MNDELNHEVTSKTVALTFRAARLTKDVLAKAFKAYLDNRQQKGPAEPKHGKMKLTELVGQGQGATAIKVNDNNIKAFEKVAKKYNVDFAVKKDKTVVPPKYMVFLQSPKRTGEYLLFRGSLLWIDEFMEAFQEDFD